MPRGIMTEPARSTVPGDLQRFIAALARENVDFVICGGVACILHGVSRVTADVDLALRMESDNLQRFIDAAKSLSLMPRSPEPLEALLDESRRRKWIAEKHAQVFTLVSPESPLQVDVFLQYSIPFDELVRQAVRMQGAGHAFRISSREHLIRAKQAVEPMRRIDQRDVEDLQDLIDRE